jgi:hypothetical protein
VPGSSFLQAFAEFFVDKSPFDRSVKEILSDADKTGKSIERSFSEGFKRGLQGGGELVEKIGEISGKVASAISSPWAAAAAVGALAFTELIKSTEAALEFDREFTKVRVLLTGSNGEIQETRRQIFQVAGGLISASEAAGVYRRAFLNTGSREAAAEIGRVAVELARVTDAAPIDTVRLLGDVLDATNQKLDQADDVAGKLFMLMKSGGGDVSQMSGGFLHLVDTAGSLGIRLEEVLAALDRLGKVSGARPETNIRALDMALTALDANAQKLREQGIDLREVVKTGGLVGALQALNVATNGSREGLRELNIQGRQSGVVFEALNDVAKDNGAAWRTLTEQYKEAGKADLSAALQKNLQAASSDLDVFKRKLEEGRTRRGLSLLDALGFSEDMDPKKVTAALEEVVRRIEVLKARVEQLTPKGERSTLDPRLGAAERELGDLFKRRAALQAIKDVQDRATKATQDATDALKGQTQAKVDAAAATEHLNKVAISNLSTVERLSKATGISAEVLRGSSAVRLQAQNLVDTIAKLGADAAARQEDLLQADVTRNQQRVQSSLSTTLAIGESERTLEVERARIEGRAAQGLESLLALRKKTAEEGAQAELKALDEITASQTRAAETRLDEMRARAQEMKSRPGFQDNLALRQQVAQLEDQIDQAEANLVKLQADAGTKRVVTEQKVQQELAQIRQKAFADRRAQIQEEQRLDDQLFAHRLAMGQATIQEEIDRARVLSMDPDRTQEERFKFAEQARNREHQAQLELADFLKSVNQLTLRDYVEFQQALTDATKRGTQERLDAEKRLADAVKAMRQAAAATTTSIFDLAFSASEKRRNAALDAEIQRLQDQLEQEKQSATPEPFGPRQLGAGNPAPEDRIKQLEREKQRPIALTPQGALDEFTKARQEAFGAAQALGRGEPITQEQFKQIQTLSALDQDLAMFGGGLQGATTALQEFVKALFVPVGKELQDRGVGSPLNPVAGEDPGAGLLRARAAADLAGIAAGANLPYGSSADLGAARTAIQAAYGSTPPLSQPGTTAPDLSGARQQAGSSEAGARFKAGLEAGAADFTGQTNFDTLGRQLAQAMYTSLYDKLTKDLETEASRL